MNPPDHDTTGRESQAEDRLSIAVFSAATATIQNTPPLVTGTRAQADRRRPGTDTLRPQRLAREATVYVEAFSAHPLEIDAASLYAAPDGYLDGEGVFHAEQQSPGDVPVYEVTLRPSDGLYLMPYVARQADGRVWESESVCTGAPLSQTRQTFYPDASRLFEEIDRFGLDEAGHNNMLSRHADFDFIRAAPSAGYTGGLAADRRTDLGAGDIPEETAGKDYFFYSPPHLSQHPALPTLARLTNIVQATLDTGRYDGAIWLEGSASIEETLYWLNLLIDTDVPLCGAASQRPHGSLSCDGDRNIVDALGYVRSHMWADKNGKDRIGAVLIQDELVFAAREVHKVDARPGGYAVTGGLGGVVGRVAPSRRPGALWLPSSSHTHRSEVNLHRIPTQVAGIRATSSGIQVTPVSLKAPDGLLRDDIVPKVSLCKYSRYGMDDFSDDPRRQTEIMGRIAQNLRHFPLSGFVLEGNAPYGHTDEAMTAALEIATFSGMPVTCVGRGNTAGEVALPEHSVFISGSNLSATKARMLLMACLLRFGAAPAAADPTHPTGAERASTIQYLRQLQHIFDTH